MTSLNLGFQFLPVLGFVMHVRFNKQLAGVAIHRFEPLLLPLGLPPTRFCPCLTKCFNVLPELWMTFACHAGYHEYFGV